MLLLPGSERCQHIPARSSVHGEPLCGGGCRLGLARRWPPAASSPLWTCTQTHAHTSFISQEKKNPHQCLLLQWANIKLIQKANINVSFYSGLTTFLATSTG